MIKGLGLMIYLTSSVHEPYVHQTISQFKNAIQKGDLEIIIKNDLKES